MIINYILISCTTILTKVYIQTKKKILGSIVGTIYSLAYIYLFFDFLFTVQAKFIIMTFIILITFGFKNKKEFIKVSIIFYMVNIFISGTTFFIMYFTGINNTKISFIIFCAYFSCELLKFIYNELKNEHYIDNIKKDINIDLLNTKIQCRALLDSGNLLKDPVSSSDIIIVKPKLLRGIIDDRILDEKDIYKSIDFLDSSLSNKIKLIPYKDITDSQNNFLLGIKANYVEIDDKKIGNIVVCLSNFDEDYYDAILNPKIIN